MAYENKIDKWTPVDHSQFKGELRTKFDKYMKTRDAADAAWREFADVAEPRAGKKAPSGQVAVLTYKRGKLLLGFKDAPKGSSGSSEDMTTL